MKIIAYSNHDKETVNDWVVAESIRPGRLAEVMLNALKATATDESDYYYKLVEDNYKLKIWKP